MAGVSQVDEERAGSVVENVESEISGNVAEVAVAIILI